MEQYQFGVINVVKFKKKKMGVGRKVVLIFFFPNWSKRFCYHKHHFFFLPSLVHFFPVYLFSLNTVCFSNSTNVDCIFFSFDSVCIFSLYIIFFCDGEDFAKKILSLKGCFSNYFYLLSLSSGSFSEFNV